MKAGYYAVLRSSRCQLWLLVLVLTIDQRYLTLDRTGYHQHLKIVFYELKKAECLSMFIRQIHLIEFNYVVPTTN